MGSKPTKDERQAMLAMGEVLRELRGGDSRQFDVTPQSEVAERLGVKQNHISMIERGRTRLWLHKIAQIAEAYGTTPGRLVTLFLARYKLKTAKKGSKSG